MTEHTVLTDLAGKLRESADLPGVLDYGRRFSHGLADLAESLERDANRRAHLARIEDDHRAVMAVFAAVGMTDQKERYLRLFGDGDLPNLRG